MVLGLGSKKKTTVKVEFQVHVQEIKPWKPATGGSAPLLILWQRGDNRYGKTRSAVPVKEDGGKVVINDSFKLPCKLIREAEGKGKDAGIAKFQKKTIVFVLQEASSGQQVARCVVNLAEYGDLESQVPTSVTLAVGSRYATAGQKPQLHLTIGPLEKKDDRSFASRVSFSSSTPRHSISKAPEKLPSGSKSTKSEPSLDDETRKALMAALISDEEDDNMSIESFTDDDSTPETPTPTTTSKSSTAATPPRSSSSRPETPKSVNKARSGSHQSAGQSSSEDPAALDTPSTSKAIPTAESSAEDSSETSKPPSSRQSSGLATPVRTSAVESHSKPSTSESSTAPSVTQLFSSDPLYKSTMDPAKLAKETSPASSSSTAQSSTAIKRATSPEKQAQDVWDELISSESSSIKVSKSSVTSSEAPKIITKLTERSGSSPVHNMETRQSVETKAPMLPVDAEIDPPQKITAPLHPMSAKAATGAAATGAAAAASAAKRSSKSSRDYPLDNPFDSSEDSMSDISNSGRSPARSTPPRAQRNGSEFSLSSLQPATGVKHQETGDLDMNVETKSVVPSGSEHNGLLTVDGKSPDLNMASTVKEFDGNKASVGTGPDLSKVAMDEQEMKGGVMMNETDLEEEGSSVLVSARANLAKVEKKALEELRNKVAKAEAKFAAEAQKVDKHQGELRDIGAMEVALYSVVAEHGSSSHKLHTPARRLARLYMHAYKHRPERRPGTAKNSVSGLLTVAKSCGTDVSRLCFWWSNVVTLRTVITQAFDTASGSVKSDANRATSMNGNGTNGWARARRSIRTSYSQQGGRSLTLKPPSSKPLSTDWCEASTYIAALEKIEEWIYSKIVETLWWQAMIPRMQKSVDASAPTSPRGMSVLSPAALFGADLTNKTKEDLSTGDVPGLFGRKSMKRSVTLSLPELGDARQGNVSVEVWKKAIMEALRRLCPVRGAGHDCGCLPMLVRMAIEGCVARLDVALFNAILREPNDDTPTDPLCDPVTDSSVLPISPGGLTFGGGSQLKNVVVTWSTFIAGLVHMKEPAFPPDVDMLENAENSEDTEKVPKFFNLIKATGDLLMLPKDILMDRAIRKEEPSQETLTSAPRQETLEVPTVFKMLKSTGDVLQLPKDLLMDKSVRNEICPMLSLQLIRRILVNFVPDEFAPDAISPSLLAALNAESTIERQRQGEADDNYSSVPMARAPSMTYVPPSASQVWSWVGETSADPTAWGHGNNSLLRKGYTSDEDLDVMEELQKSSSSEGLEVMIGGSRNSTPNGNPADDYSKRKSESLLEISVPSRFGLLKEVWGTS